MSSFLIAGLTLFALFVASLFLLYWDETRATKNSKAYMAWYHKDQAERNAVAEAWRDGGNY